MSDFEKIHDADRMTKRERVLATLDHFPVDRVALLEQLSYNPRVIADWTGKTIKGFEYTLDDIGCAIRQSCDLAMPPMAPRGTDRVVTADGFVRQNDNWTTWHVSRPFEDVPGARDWLLKRTRRLRDGARPDAAAAREANRRRILDLQAKVGETVILDSSHTGFCSAYETMGLELFSFFQADYPEAMADFMEVSTAREILRVHAVADPRVTPAVLLAEDFCTKQGSLFSPAFLDEFHYPFVKRVADAWHEHGVRMLYHSDGNYRQAIPELIACGVDGFYCLEPNCGMDIVEFKNTWPEMVWAGGVDGVDLMERGAPEQVRAEVRRQIRETRAVETGGMFVASSSEINPPIPPENFRAVVEAVRNEA